MMERLIKRGEEIARERQQGRVRKMTRAIAARLPHAQIDTLTAGVGVRDVRLLKRWLVDTDLRFLGTSSK